MNIKKKGHAGFGVGEENRRRVWAYFHGHPFSNQRQCSAALNVSEMVVSRAIKSIKSGWKPEDEVSNG